MLQTFIENISQIKTRRVVLDCENVDTYNLILTRYLTLFNPEDIVSYDLIESMVTARWRIRRAQAIESATYNLALLDHEAARSAQLNGVDPATAQAHSLCAMGQQAQQISTLQLQEDRLQRSYDRAYKLLARHRHGKSTALPGLPELLAAEAGLPNNFDPIPEPPTAIAESPIPEFNFATKLTVSVCDSRPSLANGFPKFMNTTSLIAVLDRHPVLRGQLLTAFEDYDES